jgi:EmrB/QacA subfamily drug resistance transporter
VAKQIDPPQQSAPTSGAIGETAGTIVVTDPRQRFLILAAMCSGLVAVIASVSSLNVALQALAADLSASQSELLWVVNAYTLTLAALLMPVGAIGDRIGRKIVLVTGLLVFAGANAASSFATNVETLVALRVLAGVGAAMIMPVTLSIITTSFPAQERPRAVGIWAGFAGAGGILGLFASAAIIDNSTWPWVFTVPLGLALVSLALTLAHVPRSRESHDDTFDWAGSVISVIAVGGLVLGIQEGPERGWTDALTLTGLVIGIAATIAFAVVELRRDHPLLDVREFANKSLSTGSVNLLVTFALMFALFLVAIQLLQAGFGYSALRSAVALLPMAVMMMPLSVIAPTIAQRVGYRATVATGMTLLAAGLTLMALLADLDRGYLSVLPGLLVLGVGVGLSMSPSTTAITDALPPDKQGVASALNDTVRELGGAIGIALIGAILNAQYRANIQDTADTLPPEIGEHVKEGIGVALAAAPQLGPQAPDIIQAAQQAFIDGFRPALLVGAALGITAAAYTALLGRTPTHLPTDQKRPRESLSRRARPR